MTIKSSKANCNSTNSDWKSSPIYQALSLNYNWFASRFEPVVGFGKSDIIFALVRHLHSVSCWSLRFSILSFYWCLDSPHLCDLCFWVVVVVFPCLSLLLSSYPLTHILLTTSRVSCRNSIATPCHIKLPPCPWVQARSFMFSCSPQWPVGHGEVSFAPAPLCERIAAKHYVPFDPRWPVNSIPGNCSRQPCAPMLPEVLMQVHFHGSRWAVVKMWAFGAKARGLLSCRGTQHPVKCSPVWRR